MSKIVIIDCGIGNVSSVANMFRRVGYETTLSADADEVINADKLVLPGVGAFDHAIEQLTSANLIQVLKDAVSNGVPVLGICLGMQLLFESSEEGGLRGLGLIAGYVKKFSFEGKRLKIPHMGWNVVCPSKDSVLFETASGELRFYHVHSYHVVCENSEDVSASTFYGYDFVSAVQRGNIFGVQFHPEKSHRFGMELIKKFAEYKC